MKEFNLSPPLGDRGSIFPLQRTFLNDVDESAQEKRYKHHYSPETFPPQAFEINCIGIKEYHLYIKQYKQNCDQKIFNSHWLPGFTMRFNPASEIFQFIGRFSLRTKQMSDRQ